MSLAQAREKAADLRRMVKPGIDPLDKRAADEVAAAAAAQAAAIRAKTFREVAGFYLDAHDAAWSNTKHRQQWQNTLATYAYPYLGDLPVSAVGAEHVLAALQPIWRSCPWAWRRSCG